MELKSIICSNQLFIISSLYEVIWNIMNNFSYVTYIHINMYICDVRRTLSCPPPYNITTKGSVSNGFGKVF